jgi:hypothetical protein
MDDKAMTDLRATSDAFVARLAQIADMEREKRLLAPADPAFMALANLVETAVRLLLAHSREQRAESLAAHDEKLQTAIASIPAGLSATELLSRWRSCEQELAKLPEDSSASVEARLNIEAHRRAYHLAVTQSEEFQLN